MFSYRVDDDILLRQVEPRYANAIFTLVETNRQHLRPWMHWVDSNTSVDDTLRFIAASQRAWADNQGYQASIWYHDRLCGMIGTVFLNWQNRTAELGYWLDATMQRRGIMTRSCRALISFFFHDLGMNRVQIHCATDNARSRAIPERLAFQQEGIIREALWVNYRFVDLAVYGILAREWTNH
jgi:ribosomal-protein-serine acetyltransferase